MYQVVAKVGYNVGVLDTTDGNIDWISPEDVRDYLNQGVDIVGADKNGNISPVPCYIPYNLCNWVKGQNLFSNMKRWKFSSDKFVIVGNNNKQYKGRYVKENTKVNLMFTFGVITEVPNHCFSKD